MKASIFAGLVAISTLVSAPPSFALAILVENCATADGQYSVSIIDNQGISSNRTSHLEATVVGADGLVVGS